MIKDLSFEVIALLCIAIFCVVFSYAVIKTAMENMTFEEQKVYCEKYYIKGDEEWFNCMKENR